MPYIFNPLTQNLDYYEPSGSGGGGASIVRQFVLDSTAITNKYVDLPTAPTQPTQTTMEVIGGSIQEYNVDFTVTSDEAGKRVSWAGLGLDGQVTAGDKLIIVYN